MCLCTCSGWQPASTVTSRPECYCHAWRASGRQHASSRTNASAHSALPCMVCHARHGLKHKGPLGRFALVLIFSTPARYATGAAVGQPRAAWSGSAAQSLAQGQPPQPPQPGQHVQQPPTAVGRLRPKTQLLFPQHWHSSGTERAGFYQAGAHSVAVTAACTSGLAAAAQQPAAAQP